MGCFGPLQNIGKGFVSTGGGFAAGLGYSKASMTVIFMRRPSVHPSCVCFTPLTLSATLIFMSKLVGACLLVDLAAFQPPPHTAVNES